MPDNAIQIRVTAELSAINNQLNALGRRVETAFAGGTAGANRMNAAIPPLTWSVRDMDQGLGQAHQSARLLEATLGLRLPRAVTTAVADMMPSIATLSGAMLGAFAVEKIVDFEKSLQALYADFDGVTQAAQTMADYVRENDDLLKDMARQSTKMATDQLHQVQTRVAAADSAVAALQEEKDNFTALFGVADAAMYKMAGWIHLTGDFNKAQAESVRLHKLADETAKILAGDQKKDQQDATRAANAARREAEEDNDFILAALHQWSAEDEAASQKAIRNRVELANAIREMAADYQAATDRESAALVTENKNAVTLLGTMMAIDGEMQRQAQTSRAAGTDQMISQANQTKHLSAARKELIGITQDLRQVEGAFSQAMKGEMSGLENLTQSVADIGGQFAGMIGGTKAAAGVKGAFDAASSIEYMAQFIASHGTDTAALGASVHYGLAAAEMFKVAGSSGGSRAGSGGGGGGGGGTQSSYGRSGGDRGGGSGSRSSGGGSAGPGAGTTVHMHIQGVISPDSLGQVMAQMSSLAKGGQAYLTASNSLTNAEKLT